LAHSAITFNCNKSLPARRLSLLLVVQNISMWGTCVQLPANRHCVQAPLYKSLERFIGIKQFVFVHPSVCANVRMQSLYNILHAQDPAFQDYDCGGAYAEPTLAEMVAEFLGHLSASPGSFDSDVEYIVGTLNAWVTTEELLHELVELIYTQVRHHACCRPGSVIYLGYCCCFGEVKKVFDLSLGRVNVIDAVIVWYCVF